MYQFRQEWNPYSDCTDTYYWDDVEGMTIKHTYDVTDILESNKRRANASVDSRFGNAMFHHFAEIPIGVIELWLKDGYDLLSEDPDMAKRCLRRLHDPEWRYLRTTVKKVI